MCKIEFDYNQICCGCSSVIAYNNLLDIVLEEPEKNTKETLLAYVKETYL